MPCYKYANTIDWHSCQESLIQLSKSADELIIMNKKVVGKVIHVVEPDILEVKRLQKEYIKKEKEAINLMAENNFSYKDNLLMGPD